MTTCPSCGGLLGRDCFNVQECAQITRNMEDSNFVEPYIDALKEARETINWMVENMDLKDQLNTVETFANKVDNALASIERVAPREYTAEEWQEIMDDLPF